jgi:hypothetical protein
MEDKFKEARKKEERRKRRKLKESTNSTSNSFSQDIDFDNHASMLAGTIDHGNSEVIPQNLNLRVIESLDTRAKKKSGNHEMTVQFDDNHPSSLNDTEVDRVRSLLHYEGSKSEEKNDDDDITYHSPSEDESSDDESLITEGLASASIIDSSPPSPLANDININKDDDWETILQKILIPSGWNVKWAPAKLSLTESYVYVKPKVDLRRGKLGEDYFTREGLKSYLEKHHGWDRSSAESNTSNDTMNNDNKDQVEDQGSDKNINNCSNACAEDDVVEKEAGSVEKEASDPFGYDNFDEDNMDTVNIEDAADAPFAKRDKINLTTSENAQLDLLVLLRRSGCPLNLHDRIIDWITTYEAKEPGIFRKNKLHHREGLLNKLSKMYGVSNRKPKLREMTYNNRIITIPIFPFAHELLSLLNDPELMKEQNIVPGYDIFTGKINGNTDTWFDDTIHENDMLSIPTPTDPKTKIGEVLYGTKFQKSLKRFCKPGSNHMAIPLIFFYDEAQLDYYGGIAASPLVFTVAFFTHSARARIQFWRVLSIIPNLKVGRGKSTTMTADEKAEEHQRALKIAFEELQGIFNNGGIKTKIQGRDVVLKIWIQFIIGDTKGHNEQCGQTNTQKDYENPRCCQCKWDLLSSDKLQCKTIVMNDIEPNLKNLRGARKFAQENDTTVDEIVATDWDEDEDPEKLYWKRTVENSKKRLRALSHRPLEENVFHTMWMANMARGIRGCTNFEGVHVFGQGIYKVIASSFHDSMGKSDKGGATDKTTINTLFATYKRWLDRQSERDFPRTSVRFCFTDNTKLTSKERQGNTLLLLMVLKSKDGSNTMSTWFAKRGVTVIDCANALEGILCYERWIHQANEAGQIISSVASANEVMNNVKNAFPREAQQYNFPKFHGAKIMVYQMIADGDGRNWTSEHGENFHKILVKQNADKTQKRFDSLTSQMANRVKENIIIDVSASANVDHLMFQPYQDFDPENCDANSGTNLKSYMSRDLPRSNKLEYFGGECSITIYPKINDDAVRKVEYKWKNKAKNATGVGLYEDLIYGVGKYADQKGWKKIIHITSYTSIKKKDNTTGTSVRYRCDKDYRGYPWRDWGIFDTYANSNDEGAGLCPGLICGFIRFDDNDIPTPREILNNEGGDEEVIKDPNVYPENYTKDPNIYIAIRASTRNINFDDKFINRFELERKHIRILPVSKLIGPLAVLPDIHSVGKTGMDRFHQTIDGWFTIKPYRMWGNHFGKQIEVNNREGEEV